MRAARLHAIGGTPQVDEIDEPEGEQALTVQASTLNPVDISIANGRFYGGVPEVPYVIGSEAVGVLPTGGRVWLRGRGAMAERVAVSGAVTSAIPDGVDDETALACGTAGLTGWLAVAHRAQVTAGDTVLVLGASGSVGAAAVQGAKVLGAKRVIGAAREIDRVPAVADEAVAIDGDLPEADVIIDGVWGEPAERALAAAASGVRFVQLGQSAGATATIQSAWVRGKPANILGHSLHTTPPEVLERGYRELCEHARDGRIVFKTESYELERIAEAWERQASGSPGAKIVITL